MERGGKKKEVRGFFPNRCSTLKSKPATLATNYDTHSRTNTSKLLFLSSSRLFTLLHLGQALEVGPVPCLLRVELEELGRGVGFVGWCFHFRKGKKERALGFFPVARRKRKKRGGGRVFGGFCLPRAPRCSRLIISRYESSPVRRLGVERGGEKERAERKSELFFYTAAAAAFSSSLLFFCSLSLSRAPAICSRTSRHLASISTSSPRASGADIVRFRV